MFDNWRPDFAHEHEVLFYITAMIAADEGIDHAQAQQLGSRDDFFEMFRDHFPMRGISIEWIWVITEAGNRHPARIGQVAHLPCLAFAEIGDIEMAHAGIATVSLARRPAHHF